MKISHYQVKVYGCFAFVFPIYTQSPEVDEQGQAFDEFRDDIDPGIVEINEANLSNIHGNSWIWAKPPDMLYQFSNSRREDVAQIEVCVSTNDIATSHMESSLSASKP